MKKTMSTLAIAGLMTASPMAISTAAAEWSASGNVALTSNYVFRGVSQTDNAATVQGGFDLEHSSGFYAGVWASGVDSGFYSGAEAEFDLYAGFGGEFSNGLGYDIGYLAYRYPDTTFNDNNTEEVYGSLSYDFGPAAVSVGLAYSSDWFGTDEATYTTVGVDIPLPNDFGLSLHYGSEDFDNLDDYDDWKIGLSKSWKGFDFALDYTDTDVDDDVGQNPVTGVGGGHLADGTVIFTISKSL